MNQTTVTGEIKCAPALVNESLIPSGSSIADFTSTKTSDAQTGLMVVTVTSPATFVQLDGSKTVTNGTTLYVRSAAPIAVRITQDDGTGNPDTPGIVSIQGVLLVEFDPARPLLKLEVKGSSKIEYFFSGPK